MGTTREPSQSLFGRRTSSLALSKAPTFTRTKTRLLRDEFHRQGTLVAETVHQQDPGSEESREQVLGVGGGLVDKTQSGQIGDHLFDNKTIDQNSTSRHLNGSFPEGGTANPTDENLQMQTRPEIADANTSDFPGNRDDSFTTDAQKATPAAVPTKDAEDGVSENNVPEPVVVCETSHEDTDLQLPVPEVAVNHHGEATYMKSCRKLRVTPMRKVCYCLSSGARELTMNHATLGRHETLAFCNALLDNARIVTLSLDSTRLGDQGARYISLALADNSTVKYLNLGNNCIGSAGAVALCELLLDNPHITHLDLAKNNFQDCDGHRFAQVISKTRSLQVLNLSHNSFGDLAAAKLGPAIKSNASLSDLDLSWNKLHMQGVLDIARGLQTQRSVRQLSLGMNGISLRGARAFAKALQTNSALIHLDLTYGRIHDDGAALIGKALTSNHTLRVLKLAHNPLTTAGASAVLAGVLENPNTALDTLDMANLHFHQSILEFVKDVQNRWPRFRFNFGGVVHSSTEYGEEPSDLPLQDRDPFVIMIEYMTSKDMRLLEFFKEFDHDGGGSITREEFVRGIKVARIPLTVAQLDTLMDQLDDDGDGEVSIGELMEAERQYRKKFQELRRKEMAKKKGRRLPKKLP